MTKERKQIAEQTEVASISPSVIQSGWQKLVFRLPVGTVGDSYDNALAETINGLYKADVIHKDEP